MAKKLYLSPAGHAVDNKTKCPQACSENTHCGQYMDLVEKRMKEHGVLTKRANPKWVGEAGMAKRVKEANRWGAHLYYADHTNAGGGRYSMTMCYPDESSIAMAQVFHKYRKCVATHYVRTRDDLYEINATKMPCMYDELFFHDNAEDCAWFHKVGMKLMAEETVQALCELLGVRYKPPVAEKPKKETATATKPKESSAVAKPKAGAAVKLNKGKLYVSSTGTAAKTRSGTFYLYDGKKVNGRYRVTNAKSRVGKKPVALYVSGWVKL